MHNDDTCNSYIPGYCSEIFVVSDKLIYRANVSETIVAYNTDGKKDNDFKEIKRNFEEQKYIFDKNNMYVIDYKNNTFSNHV